MCIYTHICKLEGQIILARTRNDPSLKRPRSPGDIPESLDSGHPRLVMKESANRRESAWAKKDKRQTTTLKVAARLPAALTKR